MKPNPSAPSPAALDADLVDALSAAVDPEPLAPEAHARIKRQLLRRVAADSTPRQTTLHAGQGEWRPFSPGVQIKVLNEAGGVMSYLLRLQAGAKLATHRHPVDEECVVLEGSLRVGELHLKAGDYHLGRAGVLHDQLVSPDGALIFLRGAAPETAHVV
jgi:anti-sigma factor ChrR (cupin superfamily)